MSQKKVKLTITPRKAFRAFLECSLRWIVLVAHRRAGKTVAALQKITKEALTHKRKGPPLRYAYIAPTRDQAKDIAWQYLKDFTAKIPGVKVNESELRITFTHNGAQIRLYSGENYERMRGVYFDGVVSDEDADIPPAAFDYVILACLADYEGWHVRMGTPKGKNAFYRSFVHARTSADSFALMLKASETGILSESTLAAMRGQSGEDAYRQEMECDFNVGRPGAIYANDLGISNEKGRVLPFPIDYSVPVWTTWDLGSPENTVVIYWQRVGFQYRVVDCDHHLKNQDGTAMKTGQRVALMMNKGYHFGGHLLPHDAKNKGYDAMSMVARLEEAGLSNIAVIPRATHNAEENRVQVMSDLFPSIYFNEENLNDEGGLLEALENYHRKENKKDGYIQSKINHDWCSHFADSFGYFGEALKNNMISAGADGRAPGVRVKKQRVSRHSPSR